MISEAKQKCCTAIKGPQSRPRESPLGCCAGSPAPVFLLFFVLFRFAFCLSFCFVLFFLRGGLFPYRSHTWDIKERKGNSQLGCGRLDCGDISCNPSVLRAAVQ